jgi:hypothetical protein
MKSECKFNDDGKYFNDPISLEHLVNNNYIKLSDGYCYSINTLVGFQNFISPHTRKSFLPEEKEIIEFIKSITTFQK